MELSAGAPPPPQAIAFLGVDFAALDAQASLAQVSAAAASDRFSYVVTPNVDHLVMLHERGDEPWRTAYRRAVADAALRLNDSRILARLARLSGQALPVVPGSDLTRALIAHAADAPGERRWLLVGGSAREAEWLQRRLPRDRIAHFAPPMGVRDDPAAQAAIVARVAAEQADYVLFAIGAPQSEIVAHAIAANGAARGVGLCIGASVEFLSGAKSRAPRAMQRAGLEWLYRLVSEPRRLWRRYLVRGPRIFVLWWRARRAS